MGLLLARVNDGDIRDKIESEFLLLETEAIVLVKDFKDIFLFCSVMLALICFISLLFYKTFISAY